MGQHVLVVDGDAAVNDVKSHLEQAGFRVQLAADGLSALIAVAAEVPDLVVLDLALDGIEVCRRLRADHPDLPVIVVTAFGEEADRAIGLEVAADDYITKPFSPRELVLRVRSALRRSARRVEAPPPVLRDGDLVVDTGRRVASLHDRALTLTVREFDLLTFMLRHPAHVWSREQLLEQVWGWQHGNQSTVTVHIRRLREKIEADPAQPKRLVTVWGVGYRYEPAGSSGSSR